MKKIKGKISLNLVPGVEVCPGCGAEIPTPLFKAHVKKAHPGKVLVTVDLPSEGLEDLRKTLDPAALKRLQRVRDFDGLEDLKAHADRDFKAVVDLSPLPGFESRRAFKGRRLADKRSSKKMRRLAKIQDKR